MNRTRLRDWPGEVPFAIQVSRPGLWLTAGWMYCLPVAQQPVLTSFAFWLGAVYLTFPFGYLLYGWNDVVDYEADRENPRKGTYLFGARGSREQLAKLPLRVAAVQLPFLLIGFVLIGPKFALLAGGVVAANALYNAPRYGVKNRPPFELANQLGYLLVFIGSSWLNEVPQLPWQTFVYGGLFAVHAHLFGEILDIEPDRASGRRTTAVAIGAVPAKLGVAMLLGAETVLAYTAFGDPVVTAFLALSAVWFVADATVFWKDRPYSMFQMRLFMLLWNALVVLSIGYIWRTAALTQID